MHAFYQIRLFAHALLFMPSIIFSLSLCATLDVSVASAVFCLAALSCSVLVAISCNFARKNQSTAGIFLVDLNDNGSCSSYPSQSHVDGYLSAARFASGGAVLLGSFALMLLITEILFIRLCGGCFTSVCFSLVQCAQGLTFLFFASSAWYVYAIFV